MSNPTVLCSCGKPATQVVRATNEAVCKWHKPDGFVSDRIKKKAPTTRVKKVK